MRPKTVLVTLALAMGLVIAAIALKTSMAKKADETKSTAENTAQTNNSPAPKAAAATAANPEAAQADLQKQMDEIRDLIADGPNNPAAVSLLCDKLAHQAEPSVRSAALEGVIALNDTNAIPRLEEAAQILEDPREKVAVMNAIEYLKLPESMPDTPPTNGLAAADAEKLPPVKRTPGETSRKKRADNLRATARMQRQQRQQQQSQPRPAAQQNVPPQDSTQPAGQSPDTAPPPQ